MSSYYDYTKLLDALAMDDLTNLDPADYIGFGLMNSHMYRERFIKVTAKLDKTERLMVMVLATAIKNKKRILSAMTKFSTLSWYNKVKAFFMQTCVQYTSELNTAGTNFAVVHIPSCAPFIAARVWLHITPIESRTVENFVKNLWAAQINLDSKLMEMQKEWESNFWAQTVKKGGTKFENDGFNEDYYKTKAADTYPLLLSDNTEIADGPYSYENVQFFINSI